MQGLNSKMEGEAKSAINTLSPLTDSNIRGIEMAQSNLPNPEQLRQAAGRLWGRVDKNGPVHPVLGTRCWLWTGGKRRGSYGQISVKKRMIQTHRLAFYLTYGYWPNPVCCHKCDNPPCCRPDHLFQGTPRDNVHDQMAKGLATQLFQKKTHCFRGHDLSVGPHYYAEKWRNRQTLPGM